MVQVDAERESLLKAYETCNNGYNSRDDLVQDQFHKMITVLQVFVAILLALGLSVKGGWKSGLLVGFVGAFGLLCLLALHVDLCSNASIKSALKKRAAEIEGELGMRQAPWATVSSRFRFKEERLKRMVVRIQGTGAEGDLFVTASRVLLVAWCLAVVAVAILGVPSALSFG